MTDKQQIGEMLKLDIEECAGFYSAFINDMRISKNKPLSVSKTIMSFDCPKEYILQALGIPKNAVVLTDEKLKLGEWEGEVQVMRMARQTYDACLKQTRKETAKEILDKVSRHYGGAWLVELYKEYGLEVE